MESIIDYNKAQRIKDGALSFSQISDTYIYCKLSPGCRTRLGIEDTALKINGLLIILVKSGTPFSIEINGEDSAVDVNSMVRAMPGNMVRIKGDLPDDLDADLLFFSADFMQGININLSTVSVPAAMRRPDPLMHFTSAECEIIARYFDLLHLNSLESGDNHITRNIGASLVAAMFYQVMQFHGRRTALEAAEAAPSGRRFDYVREFMRLIHLHFIKERSVTYYADKLFISPKYLSLLVKEATGRSASRWIDDFVIMEAKNMLRFSGKNIQQVAYALNFSTQSSFGKYFKHLTGMSPTQYQKM